MKRYLPPRSILKRTKPLLACSQAEIASNNSLWAVIYGACSNVGEQLARVMCANGYSVILVDRKADKLGRLRDEILRVFPQLGPDRIICVQIEFAIWRDSTSLEAKVREIF
jgi:NADP-dependent 3-hydroxy acid dehydrogenase YdfG